MGDGGWVKGPKLILTKGYERDILSIHLLRPKLYIRTWLPLVPSVLLDVSDLPLGEPALQTTREVFCTLTKV